MERKGPLAGPFFFLIHIVASQHPHGPAAADTAIHFSSYFHLMM